MRAICFDGIRRVVLCHVPEPELVAPTDAIVEVEAAGLCGSDLHVYHGREVGLDRGTIMGHEFVGRVAQIGDAVRTIQVDDRVCFPFSTNCGECHFCRHGLTSRCIQGQLFGWTQAGLGLDGCQAERVRVPLADATLFPIGDSLSASEAILLGDNLSTGFYCADLAQAAVAQVVAVVGCGTVGLLGIIAARQQGIASVYAIDHVPYRLEVAARLGATPLNPDDAEDAIGDATDGLGADSVMELVGLPEAQRLAFALLRPGGSLGVVGCHCTPHFAFSPVQAYDKNLTYRTGRCPARNYIDRLFPLLRSGTLSLDMFATHSIPFEECSRGYELFSKRDENCLKLLFTPV